MHSIFELVKENEIICPSCHCGDLTIFGNMKDGKLMCKDCHNEYSIVEGMPLLIDAINNKKDIQSFWSELCDVAYKGHDEFLSQEILEKKLAELESMFFSREHLAVVEMPVKSLSGKKILEIGPGAGAHSSLFHVNGAKVTAVDVTLNRVISTAKKLNILNDSERSIAMQADAENLPFPDNTYDIVYSNGVLHHTHNTQQALNEVYRVLKPGGSAVIMLYSKDSYLYWVNLFFLKGIVLGNIFKGKNWLGRVTEWMSDSKQKEFNPITKVYTRDQLMDMFCEFEKINIRKSGFVFEQIPIFGKLLAKIIARSTGYNNAGILVYDKPWRMESKLELYLGKYIGFAYNIQAKKLKQ